MEIAYNFLFLNKNLIKQIYKLKFQFIGTYYLKIKKRGLIKHKTHFKSMRFTI